MAVCGPSETTAWEEGESLREISSGLEQHIEILESLEPPAEVSDWHDAGLAFQRAFKETVDDYLEDSKGLSEDEFLFSMFLTLAPHFQPVEQAIAGMDPDVRSRMTEAGCIDQETSDAIPVQEERAEIGVGDTLAGSLDDPNEADLFQFQAEAGVEYVIEVAWQDMPQVTVVVKDAPDPVVDSFQTIWSETSPLVVRWAAEESKTHHIDVSSGEGTGSYTVSVSIDTSPASPAGVSAAWEGSAIKVSWTPVEGAEYYNVYHDRGGYFCSLDGEGNPDWCDELATNVVGTSYTHASPHSLIPNHYWVVACSSGGCSKIDSANPAMPDGGNENPPEDAPTATPAGNATPVDEPTATPVAEAQDTARTFLDDYLMAVCGPSETTAWEEGESIREISSGLGQHIELMESLEPPAEVSDWHEAGLAFQRAFKETVDDYLEDSKGLSEDEFLFSMFLTLAPHFQPVEQAIAGMDPDVRSRMVEAGCIDQETSGA